MIYLITVIIISLSISALCSLLEACLLSISNSDIFEISAKKPKLAEVWKRFKENIQIPIAVILIINTLAHTIGASLSGAKFDEIFGTKWIVLFSLLYSFAMIQWTEILPKAIGVKYNKKIAMIFSFPLVFFIKIFYPLIKIIEFLNKPFISKNEEKKQFDATKEINVLSKLAFLNKLISKDQEQIISRTIVINEKKLIDIMIKKEEIKFLNDKMNFMEAFIESHLHNHTRYPLIKKNNSNIVLGYINFKDIVNSLHINPENPTLIGILRPILMFYEDEKFPEVFKKLTNQHQHIAIVKNRKEELTGLITMEDIIEEIIGEIEDEYDILPSQIYQIANNRFIVGGGSKALILKEKFNIIIEEIDVTVNDWIKLKFGKEQKTGKTYNLQNKIIIIKKMVRSKVNEIIVEINQ